MTKTSLLAPLVHPLAIGTEIEFITTTRGAHPYTGKIEYVAITEGRGGGLRYHVRTADDRLFTAVRASSVQSVITHTSK